MIEILFIGVLFAGMLPIAAVMIIFLAISCGMLLYITTLLIFEEHHHSKGKLKKILTISAGIVSGILIFSF
tara:strand:+ start:387 stop:599 length:213 start_codon:yes stop_codon:yes gene_type:complete